MSSTLKGVYKFIIEPVDGRYTNKVDIDGKELIINSNIENHRFVNRLGKVVAVPLLNNTKIKVGDEVIVHHNVFRRFYDVRGKEKNGGSFFRENMYLCYEDQIFLYKDDSSDWYSTDNYCFVKPIAKKSKSALIDHEKEQPLIGVLKYSNDALKSLGFNPGDIVGFTPDSEYEFLIDDQRLYRVTTQSIIIKYEHKGDEVEYNPSWAKSS
jgi:hypothetical protein